jgi:guanylate kinase
MIIISGFAGSGKGTVVRKLLEDYPQEYALSVSATTRAPRKGEQEGVHYFFKTKEAFEEMIAKDGLFEYAQYCNNYYGTPKQYVTDQRMAGRDVILEIEMQGALRVKQQYPEECLLIFLTPPSIEELDRRLKGRGTEDAVKIRARMEQAYEESKVIPKYDYLVINDTVEECVERIHSLITNEHYRTGNNTEKITQMQQQLYSYLKGES